MEVLRCSLCNCVVLDDSLDANGFEEEGSQPAHATGRRRADRFPLVGESCKLTDELTLEAVVLLVAFNRLSDGFRFMFSQDIIRVTSPSS